MTAEERVGTGRRFARWVFLVAGISGLLTVAPLYLLEELVSRELPPAIAHPEQYYGFVGVVVAWQVLFLVLAADPLRFRPMMIPAVLEKLSFALAIWVLFLQERVEALLLGPACFDLALAVLFGMAFWRTRGGAAGRDSERTPPG